MDEIADILIDEDIEAAVRVMNDAFGFYKPPPHGRLFSTCNLTRAHSS